MSFLIIANWKCAGSKSYWQEVSLDCAKEGVELVFLLPFVYLGFVDVSCLGEGVSLGSQGLDYRKGSYTGAISADMLVDVGCRYVCLGHSERRSYFYETDEFIALSYKSAVESGLSPILCIGELLEQRESGQMKEVLKNQLMAVFKQDGFDKLPKHDIIIAYEPRWAIGAVKASSLQDVEDVFVFIQDLLKGLNLHSFKLCYGGSVDTLNADLFAKSPFIDGLLIGRASLDGVSFKGIIEKCSIC